MLGERGRLLAIMDEERTNLRKQLQSVILVESQRHAMQVKVRMAVAIFEKLKMLIISGHEPEGTRETTKGPTNAEEDPDNQGPTKEPPRGL